jgi:hypothetical protein
MGRDRQFPGHSEIGDKLQKRSIRIPKINGFACATGPEPLDRSKLYLDMMPLEVFHGTIDRPCPFKAEIAPAWRNWNSGYRIRHQSRTVQIQLSIFKPVGPPSLFGDHLDSDNIAIKGVGSFPIGHVDHAMIKPRRETHSKYLKASSERKPA